MLVRAPSCLWLLFIIICETATVKATKEKAKKSLTSEANPKQGNHPYFKRKLYPIKFGSSGKRKNLCCPVGGTPQPTISWSFEGKELRHREKYKFHKYCLQIVKMSQKDAGTYRCGAHNKYGQIQHEYRVIYVVKSFDSPLSPSNFEGKEIEKQVISRGGCGEIKCSIRNDYSLPYLEILTNKSNNDKKLIVLNDTTTGTTGDNLQYIEYDIKRASSSDQGTYFCVGYISGKYIKKTIHLTISPSAGEITEMNSIGFLITVLLSTLGTALILVFCAVFRIRSSLGKGSCHDAHGQQTSTAVQTELDVSSVNKYPPVRRHADAMMPGHLAPPNSAYGTTGEDTQ